jgi:hypothetical protein
MFSVAAPMTVSVALVAILIDSSHVRRSMRMRTQEPLSHKYCNSSCPQFLGYPGIGFGKCGTTAVDGQLASLARGPSAHSASLVVELTKLPV